MPTQQRAQVITAAPTPFTADERLDRDGVDALFDAIRARGADGVFAAGTTGEFTALDDDERIDVLAAALEVFGPEGTYAHVGAATARQAERLAGRAVDAGARRLAAVTPFFLPAPEDALLRYYERLVAAADGAEVFAYLFRLRSTTEVAPEALRRLADVGVRGAKISGESDASVEAFLAAAPEGFTVISGNDVSFGPLIRAGGLGVVSGVSSVFPEPFIALRDALRAGDADAAAAAQPRVERAVAAVKGGSIAHLKAGLEVRGLPAGPVRVSSESVSEQDLQVLRDTARDLG
ncbi:4-hydroxy-tetrahydrodipicolinate synthase [Spinactinospora alkalitolerans]|uniref:4-hydroxy-tetrahydrodipicolinate synthase n=1 Tax=Spinactinospora alkalitolerans TaxID=687207 RepID=A0A852TUF6_9ACTN|nr:dihydrodipicolinate synthase family protein [Spinactinospora alkalitolerans]NYE47669.1 4-hydroxy-tetrahydrodipicolinate synthase [Spinactinospora alkalitolerans]